MSDESTERIEIAIRAAHLAKTVLALLGVRPDMARFQMVEIIKETNELTVFLREKEKARNG